jgi:hypothetical protein
MSGNSCIADKLRLVRNQFLLLFMLSGLLFYFYFDNQRLRLGSDWKEFPDTAIAGTGIIATGWTADVQFPIGLRDLFCITSRPALACKQHLCSGYQDHFSPGVKLPGSGADPFMTTNSCEMNTNIVINLEIALVSALPVMLRFSLCELTHGVRRERSARRSMGTREYEPTQV